MNASNPRRRFFQEATAFSVGVGLARSSSLDVTAPMPIIDTHQHLWDLSRFTLPWLRGAAKLDRSFLMSDYRKATEGLNIVKSVYMEVDVEPAQQAAEADYVLELINRGEMPLVAAVISGRPGSNGFADFIARYREHRPIKGLRRVLHGPETAPGHSPIAR